MIVLPAPAPLKVMPRFGSSGASKTKVPGPISIVAPAAPSRTASTSSTVVEMGFASSGIGTEYKTHRMTGNFIPRTYRCRENCRLSLEFGCGGEIAGARWCPSDDPAWVSWAGRRHRWRVRVSQVELALVAQAGYPPAPHTQDQRLDHPMISQHHRIQILLCRAWPVRLVTVERGGQGYEFGTTSSAPLATGRWLGRRPRSRGQRSEIDH